MEVTYMSFFDSDLTLEQTYMRALQHCDVLGITETLKAGVDINFRNGVAISTIVLNDCCVENKIKALTLLLDQGIKQDEDNTLLSIAVLDGNEEIVSFSLNKIQDPKNESTALLYALNKGYCEVVFKLLEVGVRLTEEILEIAKEVGLNDNMMSACDDIAGIQKFNATISVHSPLIDESLISLEKNILNVHGLCVDLI